MGSEIYMIANQLSGCRFKFIVHCPHHIEDKRGFAMAARPTVITSLLSIGKASLVESFVSAHLMFEPAGPLDDGFPGHDPLFCDFWGEIVRMRRSWSFIVVRAASHIPRCVSLRCEVSSDTAPLRIRGVMGRLRWIEHLRDRGVTHGSHSAIPR